MPAERSVRRLSIRAPDDALAHRGSFLIEDALRTASLPGDGAGLLLIRRLRLPAFSAAASPQQVARALEASCSPLAVTTAGATDDAVLAAAEAVRFGDVLGAHQALTRLILLGAPRQAWCWPLAVSGYRPALSAGPALRAVALSLARLPEAAAALPRWLAGVLDTADVAEAATRAFLTALADQDVELLARATRVAPRRRLARKVDAWTRVFAWTSNMFGEASPRHRWLIEVGALCGATLESARMAAVASDRQFREAPPTQAGGHDRHRPLAHRTHDAPLGDAPGLPKTQAQQRRLAGQQTTPTEPPCAPGDRPASSRDARHPPAIPSAYAGATGDAISPSPGTDVAAPGESATGLDGAAPTRAGGILFLLPLLEGLGLRDWLAEDEARAPVPHQLLRLTLERLDLATDDPAWRLCGEEADTANAPTRAHARAWLGECRRALRLQVGVGVHALVCRPARLRLTDTHAELFFALDAVDLRLRRAGLDLDPGWVPWFARVVRFLYGREHG